MRKLEKRKPDIVCLFVCLFNRYKALGLTEAGHTWKLFFKIFCFLQPELVEEDSVEYGFLYEQAGYCLKKFIFKSCSSTASLFLRRRGSLNLTLYKHSKV